MNNPRWTVKRWYKRLRVHYLLFRDGPYCRYCLCLMGRGKIKPWDRAGRRATIDHLVPKSRGGSNKLSNLALCCAVCNRRKGAMSEDEYRNTAIFLKRRRSVLEEVSRAVPCS